MTNPTVSDPIGLRHIMDSNDSPDTSEDRTTIQNDEHIAHLTQEIEDLRSELTRVRDLTNLSITLQSPLPEPRSTAPNPPLFPSLDLPVPEHFPPHQPPTYTTYVTHPNPPHVNPQKQSPTHTPYSSLPTNTFPLPTTTPINPSNQPTPIQPSICKGHMWPRLLRNMFLWLKTTCMIQPIEGEIPDTIPKWFDGSKHYAYHFGVFKRDIEDYYGLKNRIEALIKEGAIQITGPHPNVNNLFPKHENVNVNMITIEEDLVVKARLIPIGKVKTNTLSSFDALAVTTQGQETIEVIATTTFMPLYNTETPTIWGVELEETLKNKTCTPFLVCPNSW
ncbi:hypothetical protein H5410_050854 [Solanum commersonii]|uniref:Uncharacterized protein n=1 Tax=Solanum commersonii TaxID=4109 RepID=A0A9J5WWP9_SOLCO|nr:hypothetical protein H5410_050854 [Solanum commersonii]